jgi:ankyrin repeat protein
VTSRRRVQDGGRTPLHWACKYDHMDIVDILLERHADINAIDSVG